VKEREWQRESEEERKKEKRKKERSRVKCWSLIIASSVVVCYL
jgi:hypothetical protein